MRVTTLNSRNPEVPTVSGPQRSGLRRGARRTSAPLVAVVVGVCLISAALAEGQDQPTAIPSGGDARDRGGLPQVIQRVMPAVVRVYGRRSAAFRGVGAGIILTEDGVIVTHTSNIADVEDPLVILGDGRRFTAEVVGSDDETEIAVLRIAAKGLPALRFADSGKVRPGEWVLAIGNPFGLAREAEDHLSANLGVITSYSRVSASGFKYRGFVFLTDAQINPGSYGGALVNLDGLLVALNGRVVTSDDTKTQMGVAIPVNDVLPTVVRMLQRPKPPTTRSAAARPTTRPAAAEEP